jgi:hypothetical protein
MEHNKKNPRQLLQEVFNNLVDLAVEYAADNVEKRPKIPDVSTTLDFCDNQEELLQPFSKSEKEVIYSFFKNFKNAVGPIHFKQQLNRVIRTIIDMKAHFALKRADRPLTEVININGASYNGRITSLVEELVSIEEYADNGSMLTEATNVGYVRYNFTFAEKTGYLTVAY